MCGIAGIYGMRGSDPAWMERVRRMTERLKHRGPDEEGYLEAPQAVFGHRRLKVIDLEGGRQPMSTEDGRVALVFNGEVYNFQAIRSALEERGQVFKTRSDTESILRLYAEKGPECLRELEGMFALAIHDRQAQTLVLAVDRFGKKPLYYAQIPGGIAFASELRALVSHPDVSRQIDPGSLSEYLFFEYVPAPATLIKGVHKLEAGTCLEATPSGHRVFRYFEHDFSDTAEGGQRDWAERIRSEFCESVRRRLVSDVPLGIFLSGGVDSSAVLAAATEVSPRTRFKTFTIEFEEPSFDESAYAAEVSRRFGTEHITEKCSARQMLTEHETILSRLDEPLADASFIPTYMLCRLARRHVTVALSGDGGDEVFAGYPTFKAARWMQRLGCVPAPLWAAARAAAGVMPVSTRNMSADFLIKQFLKGADRPFPLRDQTWLGAFTAHEQERLLAAPYGRTAGRGEARLARQAFEALPDSIKRTQAFYFQYYLQGDILVKVDRASMANSLEVRSPFLDDAFVRLALTLPSEMLLSAGRSKHILKEAFRGRLPDSVLDRPKKGFGIPIAQWIRGALKERFREVLSARELGKDGLFRPDAVESLLNAHLAGKKDNRKQLWTLYVLQLWKRDHLNG